MLTIDSLRGPRSDQDMGTSFADTVRKERARRRWSYLAAKTRTGTVAARKCAE